MNLAGSISSSGMNVAAKRLRAASHNVANLQTDGFQAVETVSQTLPGGGASSTVHPTGAPSSVIWRAGELVAGSNTDLVRESVNQITALASYRANAAVFRGSDEMTGTLLEILA
jgi:flagellar hook protein FlgE